MSDKIKDIVRRDVILPIRGRTEYDKVRFDEIYEKKKRGIKFISYLTVLSIAIFFVALIIFIMFGNVSNFFEFEKLPWFDSNTIPSGDNIFDMIEGVLDAPEFPKREPVESENNTELDTDIKTDVEGLYDFDYSLVPKDEIPIIPMDLSLTSYGAEYIHNSTGLSPDTHTLLNAELGYNSLEYISSKSPTVLIVHTHGTEAYSEKDAISYKENGGEVARSSDIENNVVSVGKLLGEALRKKGVYSVHCEIMHDADGYREAYDRAKETITRYLERYPTIKLVIDVHRDSVVKSSGELVRPVTMVEGEKAAQIMCVVGSDWGGEENSRWEANLALALQFREYLNREYGNICRPVYLKPSTYNQEIAPYSMLLEIGAAGNSIDEAYAVCDASAEAIFAILFKK